MRVSSILNASLKANFCGVEKPFVDNKGNKIIPISKSPSQAEMYSAINVTLDGLQKPMTGYNGEAFWLGEDLVVKRYKGKDAFSDDPMREINMLDSMYDHNLRFNNSQTGCFAIKTKDGECYLVSTRVNGKNPNALLSPFNKENLKSLIQIITQMDTGSVFENSSKNGFSDRCRFMNYDFNGGNINVTKSKAGLFDFEYSVIENLDDMIFKTIINNDTGANCHQSDTSPIPSSLRSFEFYTFCDYLKSADDRETLFNDYLKIKGEYHSSMADFYRSFSNETEFKDIVDDISTKEAVHSRLLRADAKGNIPFDIKKSEAIKIQMANFMHEQSQFSDTGIINPAQLKDFTKDAIEFFKNELHKAANKGDEDRIAYYKDCLELFSSWKRVNKTLSEKIERKDPEIMKKLTAENIPTLPDMLNL